MSSYFGGDIDQCFLTGYIVYPSVYQIKIKVYNWKRIYEGYTASICVPFLTQLNMIAKKLILHWILITRPDKESEVVTLNFETS